MQQHSQSQQQQSGFPEQEGGPQGDRSLISRWRRLTVQSGSVANSWQVYSAPIFRKVCHIVNFTLWKSFRPWNNSRGQRESLNNNSASLSLMCNGEQTKALLIYLISVRVKIRLPGNSKGKEGKGCCTDRDAEYFQQLFSRIKNFRKKTF